MASDDIPENEQPEIIPKPPSHPITTSLLITSCAGVVVCIGFAWAELFGGYLLSAKAPVEAGMENHTATKTKALATPIDHYALDYKVFGTSENEKNDKDMIFSVKKELKITE